MISNLDRYKKDLDKLIALGETLHHAMQYECLGEKFVEALERQLDLDKAKKFLKSLPSFTEAYQAWYTESKAVIKQLIPDRLDDFVRHYEKPKARKDLSYSTYVIEDYLQGTVVTEGWEKRVIVRQDSAIPRFRQQLAILKAVAERFESSLFDIRQLAPADLFDSELDAASELLKHKFGRAAGALAGVVLERHLAEVCDRRELKLGKKRPSISDYNNALRDGGIIDTPQWRFVQHLADIRNLCDHDKKAEPNQEQVKGLIDGVTRITKTLF